MIIPPTLVLCLTIGSLYGLVFYLLLGKGWARLPIYWLVGVVGFGFGQLLTSLVGFSLLSIGSVSLLEGSLFSWLSLIAVYVLVR